jgi:DNA-binding LacI/PurR family transcriptional regulator
VPFVTFGRPWGAPDTHPWVDVDNAAGTAEATRRLLDTGHRRIGFLGWPAGSGVGDARRSGWAGTLATAGLDAAGLDRAATDGVDTGATAAGDLLDRAEPPTALICASDSLALGALRAARDLGRHCAVVGFDDTAVAQAVGLTSVSQPLAEAAARCMDLLAGVLDGNAGELSHHVLLRPSLVIRQTA